MECHNASALLYFVGLRNASRTFLILLWTVSVRCSSLWLDLFSASHVRRLPPLSACSLPVCAWLSGSRPRCTCSRPAAGINAFPSWLASLSRLANFLSFITNRGREGEGRWLGKIPSCRQFLPATAAQLETKREVQQLCLKTHRTVLEALHFDLLRMRFAWWLGWPAGRTRWRYDHCCAIAVSDINLCPCPYDRLGSNLYA